MNEKACFCGQNCNRGAAMDYAAILQAANSLSREERIRLVEAIGQSIEAEQENAELTEEFKQELDRRMPAYEANPEKAVPREVVEAQALARWKRSPQHGEQEMTEALQQLMPQIQRLSVDERAELADLVLASLPVKEMAAIEKAWQAEVDRRLERIRSGKAKGRPVEEVLEDLRKKYP
jgi:putative addiction module component (TIGR02574 family)